MDNIKILLAEDNAINQKVISGFCQSRGWAIEVVANGKLAVDALQKSIYDLVLMDIQMPVMDGIEATRLIRSDLKLEHLPIIAVTAYALQGDRERFLNAGMDAYLPKPIDFALLENQIKSYTTPKKEPKSKLLDFSKLRKAVGLDTATICDLVEDYLVFYEERRQELDKLLQMEDYKKLAYLCHEIKGAVANFGAEIIRDILQDLEAYANAEDAEAIVHNFKLLDDKMKEFATAFAEFKNS